MKPRWVVARREFTGVFKERTILLAVVIQVFVAGFSSFLVVGLSALVDPDAFPGLGEPTVAVNGTSPLADALDAGGLVVLQTESDEAARRAFAEGRADAAALLAGDGEPWQVSLVLPDGDLRATITLVKAKEALRAWERDLRDDRQHRLAVEPVYLETDAKAGSYSFVYALLVPLLVMLPVVLAGALAADSITEEVQRGTLPLLLATPATAADVVEGKLAANVALVPLLGASWLGLLALNGLRVAWSDAALVLVLATALAWIAGLLACAVALLARDRNRTHVVYASAFFVLLAASMTLPVSPVNAIARLAAGSAGGDVLALVAACVAAAVGGAALLRAALRRASARMAAGTA